MANASKRPKASVPPVFAVNAALRLRRWLLHAADRVVPSYVAVFDHMMGMCSTMLLHTAARARIADTLEETGPLPAAELAARTGLAEDKLERLMMALISIGFFKRDRKGRFANNHGSKGILGNRDGSMRGFAEFFGYEPMLRAWATLPETLRTGENGFERTLGRPMWAWLDGDDEARNSFIEGMSSTTDIDAPAVAALYPFREVTRICDVGGGTGMVLGVILDRHPHVEGVLYDAESMIKAAPAKLDEMGVSHRVDLVAGNFLDAVPRGADAYLLKMVLHNWSDDHAKKILANCRAAMEPGHRVIAVDFHREAEPRAPLVPYMDIFGMLGLMGGRERNADDFAALYQATGFKPGRVIPLPGMLAVFEGVAV